MIDTIIDQFKAKSSLVEEGMGRAYLENHVSISNGVAIKILKHEYILKVEILERFKDAIETMTKFSNKNIFRICNYEISILGSYKIKIKSLFNSKSLRIFSRLNGSCFTLFSFSSMKQDKVSQDDFFDPSPRKN